MKNAIIVLVIQFCMLSVQAISQSASSLMDRQQFQEYNFNSNNYIRQIPSKPAGLEGSFYIREEWSQGNIYFLNNKKAENVPLRYDLVNNLLEINLPDGIRAVHGFQLHSFELMQNGSAELYISAKNYEGGQSVKGFFHVLVQGKLTLLSYITSEILAPNYNVALNVGDKNAKVVQKEKLYLLRGNTVEEIPGKKNKFLSFFGDKSDEISRLMHEKNYSAKQQADVQQVVQYYNQHTQ